MKDETMDAKIEAEIQSRVNQMVECDKRMRRLLDAVVDLDRRVTDLEETK